MPLGSSRNRRLTQLVAVALFLTGAIWLGLMLRDSGGRSPTGGANDWVGLAGSPRSDVSVGERALVVLRAPSLASRVAAAGGFASDEQEREWAVEASSDQKTIIAKLALRGAAVDPEYSFTRVLNGFSAALDAGSIAVLERSPEVLGVYPVRITYPASIDVESLGNPPALTRGYHPQVSLPPYDGQDVTIALLDTGVDRLHEYLRGHVLSGVDVVGGDPDVSAAPNPDNRSELERHGTQLAGIVVGPGALGGVAPGASIFPVRVAGWQRDASGAYEVYGRTDQLIAGLEHAVDPNGDGDAHDGARIALVGVSAPLAGFADGPEARAVRGAAALDTLVVAPAGNDGTAGTAFGTIGAPGGVDEALTVGALDLRRRSERVRVVIRSGLDVLFNGAVPLGGSAAPATPLDRSLARPRPQAVTSGGLIPAPSLESFFNAKGYSLVAGRAALVPAGDDPRTAARNASLAGSKAVVLYGGTVPSGALGLDENVTVPVVSVPGRVGREASARLGRGEDVDVSIGRPYPVTNPDEGRIAPFSSSGPSFAGAVKPDLVAPGVGIATSDAGATSEGYPAFATVSGSSAAAAVVAGAAAVLIQARPALDQSELRSLLVTTATPLEGVPVTAQGVGSLDLAATEPVSLVVQTQTLTFPLIGGRQKQVSLRLELKNLAAQAQLVAASALPQDRQDWLRLSVKPAQVLIEPGGRAFVKVTASVSGKHPGASVQGAVALLLSNGRMLRVPWALRVASKGHSDMIARATLSRSRFDPSDNAPTLLTLGIGRVGGGSGREIEPATRVDVELWNVDGRLLGVLARMRDVLPGHYVFGLTGRSPAGVTLAPGRYKLRIVVVPSGGGTRSLRSLPFTITRSKSSTVQTNVGGTAPH